MFGDGSDVEKGIRPVHRSLHGIYENTASLPSVLSRLAARNRHKKRLTRRQKQISHKIALIN